MPEPFLIAETLLGDIPYRANGHGDGWRAIYRITWGEKFNSKLEHFLTRLENVGCEWRYPTDGGRGDRWGCPICDLEYPLQVQPGHDVGVIATCFECGADYPAVRAEVNRLNRRTDVPPAKGNVEHHRLTLTRASDIAPKPVHWLWQGRIPVGALTLCAGREGVGKSILTYTQVADLTTGRLPGVYFGTPKAVVVCASEDSWSQTIVPRLMAAGADLDRVLRIDQLLNLPGDLTHLRELDLADVALLVFDPLMSRLDGKLNAHKDADVRAALEPLAAYLDETQIAAVGLIHVSKTSSTDALTTVMGSRAFAAVARAVLYVAKNPDDESVRLLGQPKNNLGRTDLPTLTFSIAERYVCDAEDGESISTGALLWGDQVERNLDDVLADLQDSSDARSATTEAMEWLSDYLTAHRVVRSDDAKSDATKAGISERTLTRARNRLKVVVKSVGFPRVTWWAAPNTSDAEVAQHVGGAP